MGKIRLNGLYCAYLRKSRRDVELEALGRGDTLARHETQLRALAERLGVRIAMTYREIVSGDTLAERPEARRLLEDVNAGLWDGVLVMDVDRLGRGDSIDQGVIMQSFLYSDTLIVTPDKIYDPSDDSDAEFFEIKLFFSRREYAQIKKRMQRGRLASAMDGCYMGTRPVYGYERVRRQGRKGWTLRVVPEKAGIVLNIYDWYAHGMNGRDAGTLVIADTLNRMGLRTDLGNPFEASYIRQILRNPAYIGKVQWNQRQTVYKIVDGRRVKSRQISDNRILVDGCHEPIVPVELWRQVQAIFDSHGKRPFNANAPVSNPFAGLVLCPVCGHHMQRKPSPSRRGDFLYCPTQRCPTTSAYIAAVEAATLDVLRGWVAEFDAADDAPDAAHSAASAVSAADAARKQRADQRAALQTQLSKQYDYLEQGVYTIAEFKARREELQQKIAALDAADARPDTPAVDPRRLIAPKARSVLEAYSLTASPADKNALLTSVIDHIEYHKTQRGLRNNKPGDNLSIVVYPRLPSNPDL